ncbi:hypothetical protein TNIN_421511 [Trichonephila inaurata madagascariensis]|uniref:Uncharacterized protein n=1 Tax=Trichonephila inaurata madagascariensis TaxID=2747483 RepID=A0A8X6X199_9ARAC|nr:hypothetical protein TNIN_421511 [Trichonephila inaurata madagascariensis]
MSSEPAPLPLDRVADCVAFEIVGIDLAGPLFLKSGEKLFYTRATGKEPAIVSLVQRTIFEPGPLSLESYNHVKTRDDDMFRLHHNAVTRRIFNRVGTQQEIDVMTTRLLW